MRSLSLSLDRLDDHLSGLILEGVQFLNLHQMKTHDPLEKHKIRAALDGADKGVALPPWCLPLLLVASERLLRAPSENSLAR